MPTTALTASHLYLEPNVDSIFTPVFVVSHVLNGAAGRGGHGCGTSTPLRDVMFDKLGVG